MKKIYSLILLSFCMMSCTPDYLQENPDAFLSVEQKYETTEDFEQALLGVYQTLSTRSAWEMLKTDPAWGNYAYGMLVLGEMGTDEMSVLANHRTEEKYLDSYAITSSTKTTSTMFGVMYMGITRANQITSRLMPRENLSDIEKAILGETLFLRALFYYNLMTSFGGVPIVTEPVAPDQWRESMERKPIEDVFGFIIGDLEMAEYLLTPEHRNGEVGRVTSIAVNALLAKMYLFAASMKTNAAIPENVKLGGLNSYDWVNAETYYQYAIDCMDKVFTGMGADKNAPLDGITYESNFWPNENGPESIFEVQFVNSTTVNAGSLLGQAFGIIGMSNVGRNWLLLTGRQFHATSEPLDKRYIHNVIKERFFESSGEYGAALTSKDYGFMKYHRGFEETESGSNIQMTPQNFVVFRLADICLMYAEAKAELYAIKGDESLLQESVAMLNNVRRRARGENTDVLKDVTLDFVLTDIPDITTLEQRNQIYEILKPVEGIVTMSFSGSDVVNLIVEPGELATPIARMRTLIMNERKWELVGEGHRWFDMVRMGWLKKVNDAMDRNYGIGNLDYLLNPRGVEEYSIFRPIPQREVDMGMKQNFGY